MCRRLWMKSSGGRLKLRWTTRQAIRPGLRSCLTLAAKRFTGSSTNTTDKILPPILRKKTKLLHTFQRGKPSEHNARNGIRRTNSRTTNPARYTCGGIEPEQSALGNCRSRRNLAREHRDAVYHPQHLRASVSCVSLSRCGGHEGSACRR